jgi:hydrogenase expression/formation protein HypD
MIYTTEFRDTALVQHIIDEIHATASRPWVIMEICGGQTHAIMKHGLDQFLPPEIELVMVSSEGACAAYYRYQRTGQASSD